MAENNHMCQEAMRFVIETGINEGEKGLIRVNVWNFLD